MYYRCSYGKGKCPQKYVPEAKLRAQLAKVVEDIRIDHRVALWIEEAITESGKEEQEFHTQEIKRLSDEIARLKARQEKMYLDKLDGLIDEEFWAKQSAEWRKKIQEAEVYLSAHLKADSSYRALARTTLELAQSAHSLFIQQDANEQRRLLEHVLSNCYLRDGIVEPEYRKPFALLEHGSDDLNVATVFEPSNQV